MPLIEDEPPRPLPRGRFITRPSRAGSGSVDIPQLKRFVFIGIESAVGILMKIDLSSPPASNSNIFTLLSSLKRLAKTQPAEPAPIIM